jgi:hypothetical protein
MVFQRLLSFSFPHKMPARIYLLSLAYHTPRPSFLPSTLNVRPKKIKPNTSCSLLTGSFYPQSSFEGDCNRCHIRRSLRLQQCDCHQTASSGNLYLGFVLNLSERSALGNIGQKQKVFYMNTWYLVLLCDWFLKWTYRMLTVKNDLKAKKELI